MRIISALLLLVACGSDDDKPGVTVLPDAAVPIDTQPPMKNVVTVEADFDMPTFIVYRDGDGPWQPAKEVSGGFELEVTDAYQVFAVCGDASIGYDVGIEASTWSEAGVLYLPCFTPFPPEAATVAVSGTMVQPGSITIGRGFDQGTMASWTFEVDVPPGEHDVAAIANHRMVLRREVPMFQPTQLPTIDVATMGTTMPAVPLSIAGLATDEETSVQSYVYTGSEFLRLPPETGTTAYVVPPSLVNPNQSLQFLGFTATSGTSERWISTSVGGQTSFTLLPKLSTVTFGTFQASWTLLPTGSVSMYFGGGTDFVHMTVSPGWLGSAKQLAVPTDVPGFDPNWLPATLDYRALSVGVEHADGWIESRYVNLGMAAKKPVRLRSRLDRIKPTRLSSSASLMRKASRIARRM